MTDHTPDGSGEESPMPTSPMQSVEVPVEAVEAAHAVHRGTAGIRLSPQGVRKMLAAAAPALRKQGAEQERERVKEAVAQPIHDLATHLGRGRMEIHDLDDPPAVVAAKAELKDASSAMNALRTALDTGGSDEKGDEDDLS